MLESAGFAIGILSLALTVVIYRRQKAGQKRFEIATESHFSGLVEMTGSGFDATSSLLQAMAQSVSQTVGDDSDEAVVPTSELPSGRLVEGGVRQYMRHEIPLKVLGDLVAGWRDEHGRDPYNNGWLVGEVEFALHQDTGRGNRPWFVVLKNIDDADHISAWKITRGGAGRFGPTVTPWDDYAKLGV